MAAAKRESWRQRTGAALSAAPGTGAIYRSWSSGGPRLRGQSARLDNASWRFYSYMVKSFNHRDPDWRQKQKKYEAKRARNAAQAASAKLERHTAKVVEALQNLDEAVTAPDRKAIKAVLLVLDDRSPVDAASRTGSSLKSISEYLPLIKSVQPSLPAWARVETVKARRAIKEGVAKKQAPKRPIARPKGSKRRPEPLAKASASGSVDREDDSAAMQLIALAS